MKLKDKILKEYIEKDIFYYRLEKSITKKTIYYETYINIIKKLVNLLKELTIYNPLEVKIIYEYLLYNGYLSIDKKFKATTENRILNRYIPGVDIIRGNGVCINISDFLKTIYEIYGYSSYILTCSTTKKSNKLKYEPNIKQDIGNINISDLSKNKIINYLLNNTIGSHAITLVNTLGNTYLCDATNLDFINLNNNFKGNYLFNDIDIKVLLSYFGLLNDNIDELNILLLQTKNTNLENIKDLYENLLLLCQTNKETFDKFHESIKNDIDIVCKSLK